MQWKATKERNCKINYFYYYRHDLYLHDYKQRLSEMSSQGGYTWRMLYSPISKILSIHYFYIKSPYTNYGLTEELKIYKEHYTQTGEAQELYCGDKVSLKKMNLFQILAFNQLILFFNEFSTDFQNSTKPC